MSEIKNLYDKAQTELTKSLQETESIADQNMYAHMIQDRVISAQKSPA